jgi:hypothetical protein
MERVAHMFIGLLLAIHVIVLVGFLYQKKVIGQDLETQAFEILRPRIDEVFYKLDQPLIPLRSTHDAEWFLNGHYVGRGRIFDLPSVRGQYEIKARRMGLTHALGVEVR